MNQSNIFTKAELEEIKRQQKGNKNDKTGIFSKRIRPKINEILNSWFPKATELAELVRRKRD